MRQQREYAEAEHEEAEQDHAGLARQVDEQRDAERRADENHRHQARPFGAHRVLRILEADAERSGEVGEHEERERELERHQVRGERNGDQRGAEAGDTEHQRAEERDPGERGRF